MTPEELSEIVERSLFATFGEWAIHTINDSDYNVYVTKDDGDVYHICSYASEKDAEFIAHARQDIPDLISEIERLQAQIDTMRKEKSE